MTRATTTNNTDTDTGTEPTTTKPVPTDERNWMLDLLDWPTFFGRRWRGGLPTGFLDSDFFGDRFERRFPMRVEQHYDGDDLVIRAELPGIDPDEDVEIDIEGRHLTIEATREESTESDADGYRSEFHYGHFHRMMTLPDGADIDAVTASYTDGILEVRVPVDPETERTTKVPVTRG